MILLGSRNFHVEIPIRIAELTPPWPRQPLDALCTFVGVRFDGGEPARGVLPRD